MFRKVLVPLLILLPLVIGGCAPPVDSDTDSTGDESGVPVVTISSDPSVVFVWNMPYKKQLFSTPEGCIWSIVAGSLPVGIELAPDGMLSGQASVLDDSGAFTVKAELRGGSAVRLFRYRVEDRVWVTPVTVNVKNLHPGARAEQIITIHNDYSVMEDLKKVTTDETDVPDARGFIRVPITLKQPLYQNSDTSVLSITSDNPKDELRAVSYDSSKGVVTIDGFAPLDTRIICISYVANSLFAIQYDGSIPILEGYVKFSEESFVLAPHETRNIVVAIDLPDNAVIGLKEFKFKTIVGRAVRTGVSVTVTTAMATTFQVKMRGY